MNIKKQTRFIEEKFLDTFVGKQFNNLLEIKNITKKIVLIKIKGYYNCLVLFNLKSSNKNHQIINKLIKENNIIYIASFNNYQTDFSFMNFYKAKEYRFMNLKLKNNIDNIDINKNYEIKEFNLEKEIDEVKLNLANIFEFESIDMTKIDDIYNMIQNKQSDGLLIKDGQKVIATGFSFYNKKNALIDFITVNKEYRNQKLGKKVFSEILKLIVKRGYKNVCLISSKQAENIYKQFGFKVKNYYFEEYEIIKK